VLGADCCSGATGAAAGCATTGARARTERAADRARSAAASMSREDADAAEGWSSDAERDASFLVAPLGSAGGGAAVAGCTGVPADLAAASAAAAVSLLFISDHTFGGSRNCKGGAPTGRDAAAAVGGSAVRGDAGKRGSGCCAVPLRRRCTCSSSSASFMGQWRGGRQGSGGCAPWLLFSPLDALLRCWGVGSQDGGSSHSAAAASLNSSRPHIPHQGFSSWETTYEHPKTLIVSRRCSGSTVSWLPSCGSHPEQVQAALHQWKVLRVDVFSRSIFHRSTVSLWTRRQGNREDGRGQDESGSSEQLSEPAHTFIPPPAATLPLLTHRIILANMLTRVRHSCTQQAAAQLSPPAA